MADTQDPDAVRIRDAQTVNGHEVTGTQIPRVANNIAIDLRQITS